MHSTRQKEEILGAGMPTGLEQRGIRLLLKDAHQRLEG